MGSVSQNHFCHTKFVNAMKRHSAANFVQQIHVVNSFVKLAPGNCNCLQCTFSVLCLGIHFCWLTVDEQTDLLQLEDSIEV